MDKWSHTKNVPLFQVLASLFLSMLGIFMLLLNLGEPGGLRLQVVAFAAVIFTIALRFVWTKGWYLKEGSLWSWNGPLFPVFRQKQAIGEYLQVSLQTKAGGKSRLALQRPALSGKVDELVLEQVTALDQLRLVKPGLELAKALQLDLALDEEIIPNAHLSQDIRERAAASQIEYADKEKFGSIELERNGERLQIKLPTVWSRCWRKHYIFLPCLTLFGCALMLAPLMTNELNGIASLAGLLALSFVGLLTWIEGLGRVLVFDKMSLSLKSGRFFNEKMALTRVYHLFSQHEGRSAKLVFVGDAGLLRFELGIVEDDIPKELLDRINDFLADSPALDSGEPDKVMPAWTGFALVCAFLFVGWLLMMFGGNWDTVGHDKFVVSDAGYAFHYDWKNKRLRRWSPNATLPESIQLELPSLTELEVSADGELLYLATRSSIEGKKNDVYRLSWSAQKPERLFSTEGDQYLWNLATTSSGDALVLEQFGILDLYRAEDDWQKLELSAEGYVSIKHLADDILFIPVPAEQEDAGLRTIDIRGDNREMKEVAWPSEPPNRYIDDLVTSPDGGFLVFSSRASNLGDVEPDTDNIFLLDRSSGEIELISRSRLLEQPANASSSDPDVSADGNLVLFQSDASNLVQGDLNDATDAFLYNRADKTLTLVNKTAEGRSTELGVSRASLTSDGSFVFFHSFDSLTEDEGTNWYRYEVATGKLERLRDAENAKGT